MSMMATIETGDGWAIEEDMTVDEIILTVKGSDADYLTGPMWCRVKLTPEVIDALRAMQSRFLPHLREQRAAIFSERSKKGWQTRRNEGRAQQDADIKTLINMEG